VLADTPTPFIPFFVISQIYNMFLQKYNFGESVVQSLFEKWHFVFVVRRILISCICITNILNRVIRTP
jgi:hypothetical protein